MKSGEKTKSAAKCIIKGAALALVTESVLLLLLAALTSAGMIGEGNIAPLALVCGALCCFAGSLLCAKSVKKYALPCALGAGAAFVAINACVGSLLLEYAACGNPFVCVPAYLGASVTAAFVSAVGRRSR